MNPRHRIRVLRVAATADQPAGEGPNLKATHVVVGNKLAITLPFGDLSLDAAAITLGY